MIKKSETNQQEITTYTPDPGWDYYMIWHNLQRAKAKIDEVLYILKKEEYASSETDVEVREIIEPLRDNLNFLLDNELDNSIDDDDDNSEDSDGDG